MGWRGYMLTRLIDAEFSRPILISGLIWATWHVPIVIAGLYVEGTSALLSVLGIYFVLCHSVILQLIYDLSQVAFGLRLSFILLGMPLFKDLSHVQVQEIKLRFDWRIWFDNRYYYLGYCNNYVSNRKFY